MHHPDPTCTATAPLSPRPFVVQRVRRETADTVTIELLPESPTDGFTFAAGQFTMLYRFGIGEVPISISGDPTRPLPLVHTVRAVGAVTRAICAVKRGDILGVRGPYGSGWPIAAAAGRDVVLMAGGAGLAPLRSALLALLANRKEYGRILLLYGARRPEELLYQRFYERWRQSIEVGITIYRPRDAWQGHVGVVAALLARERLDPTATVAFICSSEVMMRFSVHELERQGVPHERIFVSLERNMKCAVRLCGRCQLGPAFICHDGPVFRYDRIRPFMAIREY